MVALALITDGPPRTQVRCSRPQRPVPRGCLARWASFGAIPSAGAFLFQALADTLQWPTAVGVLSPFDHLNAVSGETPDWAGAGGVALIGVALAVTGLLGYRRRDLQA